MSLSALIVAIVLFTSLLWSQQRRLIYFPDAAVPPQARVGLPDAESVSFQTDDGVTLHGWFTTSTPSHQTVIVFNGNGGNRAYRARLAAALASRGFGVLLFDYRGYGENAGRPTESGLALDARAAQRFVRTREVDPQRLVYLGESLGTAVATRLAATHRPSALILRSPFTSMADVGRYHYPWLPVRWLLRDRYEILSRLSAVEAPILVIAGSADRIVPVAQSQRVYEHADEPKQLHIVSGADHNDEALMSGREVVDVIVTFLRSKALSL